MRNGRDGAFPKTRLMALPDTSDSMAAAYAALCATLRAAPDEVAAWGRLRQLLLPTDPLAAAAAAQRAFHERNAQLVPLPPHPDPGSRAQRRANLLPMRAHLAEALIAAGFYAEARYHYLKLRPDEVAVLPDAAELPRLNRWMRERWRATAYADEQTHDPTLAERLILHAARLVMAGPLAEWPAVLVEHVRSHGHVLLLPREAVVHPSDQLVRVSDAVFPALATLPLGSGVQVRVAPATQGSRPEVFALAPRPAAPLWEGFAPPETAVVLHYLPNSDAPPTPTSGLLLSLTDGGRCPVSALTLRVLNLLALPERGESWRVHLLRPPLVMTPRVVAFYPDPYPDPAVWRRFEGAFHHLTPDFGYVCDQLFVHRSLLPADIVWAEGTRVRGVAAWIHEPIRDRRMWRAVLAEPA